MSVRNDLGQEIKVGSPVVLVVQGTGTASICYGRVDSFSKGKPRIRYTQKDSWGGPSDGSVSPAIERYERLFVLSEEEYDRLAARTALYRQAQQMWISAHSRIPTYVSHPDYPVYKSMVNNHMLQNGQEPYYD